MAPSPMSKWSRMSPSTSEMTSSTRPRPPTIRKGRSNVGGLSCARIPRATTRGCTHPTGDGVVRASIVRTFVAPASRERRMAEREGVDGRVAADPAHARHDLVDDRGGERCADDAVPAGGGEAARADAHDLPAHLAERLVLLEVGALLEPAMGSPRAAGIVVLDRDAQLRHEDVGPDLLATVERAGDAHRVDALVQPDALAQQHPEPLLGLRGARAQAGVHVGDAGLARGGGTARVDPALGAAGAGEHLADRGGVPIVPARA